MLALADLNDSLLSEIPQILWNSIICYSRIYTAKGEHSEIILTNGPILYEIRNRHVVSSIDLTSTIVKGKQTIFVN